MIVISSFLWSEVHCRSLSDSVTASKILHRQLEAFRANGSLGQTGVTPTNNRLRLFSVAWSFNFLNPPICNILGIYMFFNFFIYLFIFFAYYHFLTASAECTVCGVEVRVWCSCAVGVKVASMQQLESVDYEKMQ